MMSTEFVAQYVLYAIVFTINRLLLDGYMPLLRLLSSLSSSINLTDAGEKEGHNQWSP